MSRAAAGRRHGPFGHAGRHGGGDNADDVDKNYVVRHYRGRYHNLASFTDLSTVSGYALESMNWAVGEKLLKGANSKLDPKANATRAQVAAIIHRYLER